MKKITLGFVGILMAFVLVSPMQGFAATAYKLTTEQQSVLVQTLSSLSQYLDALGAKITQLKASGELTESKKAAISSVLSSMGSTLGALDQSIRVDAVSKVKASTGNEYSAIATEGDEYTASKATDPKSGISINVEDGDAKTGIVKGEDGAKKQVAGVAATTGKTGRFLWWSFILLLIATAIALFYSWKPDEVTESTETPQEGNKIIT